MTTASEKMIQAIEYVVKPLNVGTNIALLYLLWAMVSGAFLQSRGAVHTALKLSGRKDEEIRRSGNALRTGQWQISELITRWREWVMSQRGWETREHEGWHAVSCDVVVFPRLKLKGWVAKLYRGTFGKAVKAVGFGVIVDVGQYGQERVALLRRIVRCRNVADSETQLLAELLAEGAKALGDKGVFVHDAGVSVKAVQAANIERYVIRLAKNCVARWPYLPDNAHGNRQFGELIRPLARSRKGKETAATKNPTEETAFQFRQHMIKAQRWRNVVGSNDRVADDAARYDIWIFLTPIMQSHSFWRPILMQQHPRFSICTLTAGLSNSCPWLLSR